MFSALFNFLQFLFFSSISHRSPSFSPLISLMFLFCFVDLCRISLSFHRSLPNLFSSLRSLVDHPFFLPRSLANFFFFLRVDSSQFSLSLRQFPSDLPFALSICSEFPFFFSISYRSFFLSPSVFREFFLLSQRRFLAILVFLSCISSGSIFPLLDLLRISVLLFNLP